MTGIYERVRRADGSYVNLEVDRMTDDELMVWVMDERESHRDGWRMVLALARWIRENVREGHRDGD